MDKTKIVATLGPACEDYSTLRKMINSGLEVARFNFSHGTHQSHFDKMKIIKTINKKYKRHIKFLQDLEGYRVRVGTFGKEKTKTLKRHEIYYLKKESSSSEKNVIPFDYGYDLKDIGVGQDVFIDDGNISLKVKDSSAAAVKVEVIGGGILKPRKGINIPGVVIPFIGVTEKDKKDIAFGVKHKFDWVAQSFVRTKKDMEDVIELVRPHNPKCQFIAKIESRQAIRNLDKIMDVCDGIMVARGDMGVALPIYQVPIVQKMIISKCIRRKKFVITATQMLESMTERIRPTRAEVNDVANAIIDGTNYVMLSAESASGMYPVESIAMMKSVIKFTEKHMYDVQRYRKKG
ncbi:MAG: pyruvate kinase [Candidatus Omnitrophica bacterium]|nr:pyruvate kinase [Candidatus Omnitrophota bacterium]